MNELILNDANFAFNRLEVSMSAIIHDLFGKPEAVNEVGDDEAKIQQLNTSLRGRYAEFMVCAQISKAGYYVTHVDGLGFDLVVKTDNGSYTIQVKSSEVIHNGSCRWTISTHVAGDGRRTIHRKSRPLMPSDADLLALFHHTYGTTIILPITDHMSEQISFRVHQVEQAKLEESLSAALKLLGD